MIFTAHSVPQRTIADGDPYEAQTKETAMLVAREPLAPDDGGLRSRARACRRGMAWPDGREQILALKEEGHRGVFVQPIGFLCDHVEVLYDIDIGFKELLKKKACGCGVRNR